MQSLAISASEAAEQGFLPTITAGPDRRAQVTAPGSNPYRTYALGGMGYLLAAMIAWRPGQSHGLNAEYATKIQA